MLRKEVLEQMADANEILELTSAKLATEADPAVLASLLHIRQETFSNLAELRNLLNCLNEMN
jgi:hypothetical protein